MGTAVDKQVEISEIPLTQTARNTPQVEISA